MINIEEIQAQIKQYEQIKDWFKNRTDFRYNWNEPYLFWYEGSHSKFYRNEVEGLEPITYRISVYIRTEYIEVQAKIYDQTNKNNCKVLDKKGKNFKFEVVQDENLAPIIGYVQKLDTKFDKQVKDYFFQNKLKKMQTDF
jgi:hypothetical protein